MYCPKCGAAVQSGVKFCSACGARIEGEPVRSDTYVYEQPIRFECGIEQRDIAEMLILTIVTFGIYGIYWFIKLVDEVNRASNDQNAFSGGITWLLSFLTCGIYGIYWYYQAGKKMTYAKQVRHMPTENNVEFLYLLLSVFGMGIVVKCLIQSDLNKMA